MTVCDCVCMCSDLCCLDVNRCSIRRCSMTDACSNRRHPLHCDSTPNVPHSLCFLPASPHSTSHFPSPPLAPPPTLPPSTTNTTGPTLQAWFSSSTCTPSSPTSHTSSHQQSWRKHSHPGREGSLRRDVGTQHTSVLLALINVCWCAVLFG